jgi:hypothetical protein
MISFAQLSHVRNTGTETLARVISGVHLEFGM